MKLVFEHRAPLMFAIAILALLAMPVSSSAQTYSFTSADAPLSLTADPQSPAPGQSVTLTVSSASGDLPNARISWYMNGALATSGTGAVSYSTTAGRAGTTESIRVAVTYADGSTAGASTTLRPTNVNILWEGASYTPPFYRGRSLPSANAPVRLHADAQFIGSNGALIPEGSIIYDWTINARPAQSLSGLGRSTLTLSGPALYGALTVTVDAHTASGQWSGSRTVSIPAVSPIIDLYASDPLLGITYRNAIGNGATLRTTPATIAAEPYFFAISSPTSANLAYSWRVNGTPVLADASNPSRLTLTTSNGSAGSASVSLSLMHSQLQSETASGAWTINIAPVGGVSTPFTATQR